MDAKAAPQGVVIASDFAASRVFVNVEGVGNGLLDQGHMRNDTDCPPLAGEIGQNLQDLIQRARATFPVEAADGTAWLFGLLHACSFDQLVHSCSHLFEVFGLGGAPACSSVWLCPSM